MCVPSLAAQLVCGRWKQQFAHPPLEKRSMAAWRSREAVEPSMRSQGYPPMCMKSSSTSSMILNCSRRSGDEQISH